MWVGDNESSKYWLMVLNQLKDRGVEDILISSTDNLTGFSERYKQHIQEQIDKNV